MQGYALMCVGYPLTDVEVETQDEDEVRWPRTGLEGGGWRVEAEADLGWAGVLAAIRALLCARTIGDLLSPPPPKMCNPFYSAHIPMHLHKYPCVRVWLNVLLVHLCERTSREAQKRPALCSIQHC